MASFKMLFVVAAALVVCFVNCSADDSTEGFYDNNDDGEICGEYNENQEYRVIITDSDPGPFGEFRELDLQCSPPSADWYQEDQALLYDDDQNTVSQDYERLYDVTFYSAFCGNEVGLLVEKEVDSAVPPTSTVHVTVPTTSTTEFIQHREVIMDINAKQMKNDIIDQVQNFDD